MSGAKSKPGELRQQRRVSQHGCWDFLIIAPLWVAYEANLGTLLRTCDAIGACLAVPSTPHYKEALLTTSQNRMTGDTNAHRFGCDNRLIARGQERVN